MRERLNSQPDDMNKLFERMLSDVDPVYWKSLAFYVQLMRLGNEDYSCLPLTTVSIIATAQLNKRIYSYEEFANECKRTETQITTQSAGLLEIHNDRTGKYSGVEKAHWEKAEIKHVSDRPGFLLRPEDFDRRRCSGNEPYPIMLDYEARRTKWIHRSAYEFISNLNEKKNLLFELSSSRQELVKLMGEGWISYIMAAPSYVKFKRPGAKCGKNWPLMKSLTVERLRFFFEFISTWKDVFPKTVSTLLDNLCSICIQINDMDEFYGTQIHEWLDADANTYAGKVMFWSECAIGTLLPYIVSRMDRILEGTGGDSLIAHLLACSLYSSEYWRLHRYPADLEQFNDAIAEVLLQRTIQKFECQATEYKCITKGNSHRLRSSSFICATWKEPAIGGSMDVMTRLILWLGSILSESLMLQRTFVRAPASLSTLMAVSDLYLAPDFRLNRMYVQVSAAVWTKIYYAIMDQWKHLRSGGKIGDIIGNAFYAGQVDRAVRIPCVPPAKKRKLASHKNADFGYYGSEVSWDIATEWESSRVVTLQPRIATSARLLGLLAWHTDYADITACRFGMIRNIKKRREVCEMLLENIKVSEQDLDGGQQLVAAACVRAGLLDPDIEGTGGSILRYQPSDENSPLDEDELY
ncbi:hypothetical protein GGR58DRAFT_143488 [Xylaria digitata]|nr:hypothetical protein GGR58DRAFT_143488 [Xylaria digitata]